jgi:hypothetical protein
MSHRYHSASIGGPFLYGHGCGIRGGRHEHPVYGMSVGFANFQPRTPIWACLGDLPNMNLRRPLYGFVCGLYQHQSKTLLYGPVMRFADMNQGMNAVCQHQYCIKLQYCMKLLLPAYTHHDGCPGDPCHGQGEPKWGGGDCDCAL